MNEREAVKVMQQLRELLPSELMLSLQSSDLAPSSSWTEEEYGRALRANIVRFVKGGWTWNPPYLEKEAVFSEPDERDSRRMVVRRVKMQKRPSVAGYLPVKTPADRGFNPRKDALALRLGARFMDSGPWVGQYEIGANVMRHDGSLLDTEACPECQGSPYFVQKRSVFDRAPQPRQVFTYCRRCVSVAEIEAVRRKAEQRAEEATRVRRGSR